MDKAKKINYGKLFEEDFKNSIDEETVYFQRIKDSAASFGRDSSMTRFTLKNPYDNFAYKYPYFYALELKSTKTKSLSFSLENDKKQIKKCQIEGLNYARKYKGISAGFVLNFREQEETYYLDIYDFLNFVETSKKSSINLDDVKDNNGILIKQEKLRTRYRYNLDIIFKKGDE